LICVLLSLLDLRPSIGMLLKPGDLYTCTAFGLTHDRRGDDGNVRRERATGTWGGHACFQTSFLNRILNKKTGI